MTDPGDMVGVAASTLARLVWNVVATATRENLTVPPLLHEALVEALVALDVDADLNNVEPLRRLLR